MTVKLSHIAIATPAIQKALEQIQVLALEMESDHDVPSEKVRAAMVQVEISPFFRIEFLEPTSKESPISKFLEKRPNGGIHHLCFQVSGLEDWEKKLEKAGYEVLAPGIRKAARGRALFIHPKNMGGVLVELEEILS